MWSAFILYENTLFARGLEKLLREQGVEVVGVAMKKDKQALDKIKRSGADVIIAEGERKKSVAEVLLSRLLRERPEAKVVRVSLEDSSATLYTGNRWMAHTVRDLVKGIVGSIVDAKPPRKRAQA